MLRYTEDSDKVPGWAVVYKPQAKCFTCLCNRVIYWGRTPKGEVVRAIRCSCGKWHLRESYLGQYGALTHKVTRAGFNELA